MDDQPGQALGVELDQRARAGDGAGSTAQADGGVALLRALVVAALFWLNRRVRVNHGLLVAGMAAVSAAVPATTN